MQPFPCSPRPAAAVAPREREREQSDHPGVPGVLPPRTVQRRDRGGRRRRHQPREPPRVPAADARGGGQRCPLQSQAKENHFRELCVREETRVQDVLVRPLGGAEEFCSGAPPRPLPVELRHPGPCFGEGGQWQRAGHGAPADPACAREEEVHWKHVHHEIHEKAPGC